MTDTERELAKLEARRKYLEGRYVRKADSYSSNFSIYMPKALKAALVELAASRGTSVSAVLQACVALGHAEKAADDMVRLAAGSGDELHPAVRKAVSRMQQAAA